MIPNVTNIFEFSPIYLENNSITIQPNKPATLFTGYSICIRAMFWKWDDNTNVFKSKHLTFTVNYYYPGACFYVKESPICFDELNISSTVSMEWKSICISHNFSNFNLRLFMNGELHVNQTVNQNLTLFDNLFEPFIIGQDFGFFGQITDFNIWNVPLSEENIKEFSCNFNTDLVERIIPEVLNWSNINLTYKGNNTKQILIDRRLLSNQICSEDKHFFIFNCPGIAAIKHLTTVTCTTPWA